MNAFFSRVDRWSSTALPILLLLTGCGAAAAGAASPTHGVVVGAACSGPGGSACGYAGSDAAVLTCSNGTWQTVVACTGGRTCTAVAGSAKCSGPDAGSSADASPSDGKSSGLAAGCHIEPAAFTFTNVTASNPQTACFSLRNTGNTQLSFTGAAIDPVNAQYTLTEQPNSGDTIAGVGTTGNVDGSQSLKTCVKYTPDSTPGNEQATLVVLTSGQPSACAAALDAVMQQPATITVTCGGPGGKLEYSFPNPVAGSAKCTICNNGPPPVKVQNAGVVASNPTDQAKANANYKAELLDSLGYAQALLALAPQKCTELQVTYTPQNGQSGPGAYASYTYGSVGLSNQGTIPIVAGP